MNHNNTKRKLYDSIMSTVSSEVYKALNEVKGPKSKVSVKEMRSITVLKNPVIVKGIELNEPIFTSSTQSAWYKSFVMSGGAAYTEKHMGMDSHTFICSSKKSIAMLYAWLKKQKNEDMEDVIEQLKEYSK